jgi:hypothetical protein
MLVRLLLKAARFVPVRLIPIKGLQPVPHGFRVSVVNIELELQQPLQGPVVDALLALFAQEIKP